MHLYRAIDSVGDAVEFCSASIVTCSRPTGSSEKALAHHGRPVHVVIDGSKTNQEVIVSCDVTNRLQDRSGRRLKPIRSRKTKCLNKRIEQDHRCIKRRIRSMLGFKSPASAAITLNGIEMVDMMREQQARFAFNPNLSLAEQFQIHAA